MFLVEGNLFAQSKPISIVPPYGGSKGYEGSHILFWDDLQKNRLVPTTSSTIRSSAAGSSSTWNQSGSPSCSTSACEFDQMQSRQSPVVFTCPPTSSTLLATLITSALGVLLPHPVPMSLRPRRRHVRRSNNAQPGPLRKSTSTWIATQINTQIVAEIACTYVV